jgi:hypothetical protein
MVGLVEQQLATGDQLVSQTAGIVVDRPLTLGKGRREVKGHVLEECACRDLLSRQAVPALAPR